MGLIKCDDCGRQVSESAESCPGCARPLRSTTRKEGGFLDPRLNAKKLLRIALILVCLGLPVVWFGYTFLLDREGKDTVNVLTGVTGIGKQLIPWSDRAESSVRMCMGTNESVIAASIQGITHPSGSNSRMLEYEVRRLTDAVSVRFIVEWQGGLSGTRYKTVVVWDFGADGHIRAVVTGDEAPFAVDKKNAEALDEYFRSEIFPIVLKGIGT